MTCVSPGFWVALGRTREKEDLAEAFLSLGSQSILTGELLGTLLAHSGSNHPSHSQKSGGFTTKHLLLFFFPSIKSPLHP